MIHLLTYKNVIEKKKPLIICYASGIRSSKYTVQCSCGSFYDLRLFANKLEEVSKIFILDCVERPDALVKSIPVKSPTLWSYGSGILDVLADDNIMSIKHLCDTIQHNARRVKIDAA